MTAMGRERRRCCRPSAAGYLVTSVLTTQLGDETFGPHVVQVTSETAAGVTTLQVSFDSDLNAPTVAGAITIFSGSGVPLDSTTVYHPDSRTATVTVVSAPKGTFTLDIATTLADVYGQILAHSFQTQVAVFPRPGSAAYGSRGWHAPGCESFHRQQCTIAVRARIRPATRQPRRDNRRSRW